MHTPPFIPPCPPPSAPSLTPPPLAPRTLVPFQVAQRQHTPQPELLDAVCRSLVSEPGAAAWRVHKGADVAGVVGALASHAPGRASGALDRLMALAAAGMPGYSLKEVGLVVEAFRRARYSLDGQVMSAAMLQLSAAVQALQAGATAAAETSAAGRAVAGGTRQAGGKGRGARAPLNHVKGGLDEDVRRMAVVRAASLILPGLAAYNFHCHDVLLALGPHVHAVAVAAAGAVHSDVAGAQQQGVEAARQLSRLLWSYATAGHPNQLLYHALLRATAAAESLGAGVGAAARALALPEQALLWQATVAVMDMLDSGGSRGTGSRDSGSRGSGSREGGDGLVPPESHSTSSRGAQGEAAGAVSGWGDGGGRAVQHVLRCGLPVDASVVAAWRDAYWEVRERQPLGQAAAVEAVAGATARAAVAAALTDLCAPSSSSGSSSSATGLQQLLRGRQVHVGGATSDGALPLDVALRLPSGAVCLDVAGSEEMCTGETSMVLGATVARRWVGRAGWGRAGGGSKG